MPVDAYAALKELVHNIFTDHQAAVEFTEDPSGTLVAEGITDGDLASVDFPQLVSETAAEVPLSEATQQALAEPGAAQFPISPPEADGPLTLEQAVQHLNYVTYATYQGDEEIFQNISNQEFSFDNRIVNDESTNIGGDAIDASTNVDADDVNGDLTVDTNTVTNTGDGVAAGDDVAVAEGDGAVAAGGDLENVITGDDNQLVDGDGNLVAGGDLGNVAFGDNAVAADDFAADGGVLVDGDNSGQINTCEGAVQAGESVVQAGGDALQAGGDAVQAGGDAAGRDLNVLGEGAVQAGDDIEGPVNSGELTGIQSDGDVSDLQGLNFGDGDQVNTNTDLSGAQVDESALAIGGSEANNAADVTVDDGSALAVGGGGASGSNVETEIDTEVDINDSLNQDNDSLDQNVQDSFNEELNSVDDSFNDATQSFDENQDSFDQDGTEESLDDALAAG